MGPAVAPQRPMTRGGPFRAGRTVVLVGLMGAGKSTVGKRLAARLGVPFTDADAEIERAAGSTIEDIFEMHGEAAFRDGERRVIERLLNGPVCVLATGGGAFMDPETRGRIRDRAVSVWLRADLELLLKRTARRGDRPLLKRGNPRDVLDRLMGERHPLYAEADIIVDSGEGPHEEVVQRILERLVERGDAAPARQIAGAPR